MIMDQPNEDENTSTAKVFPVPPHIWITLGSVLFLMLPSSCHILYMGRGNYILGRTCTTGSEWLWIGTFSALLLLPLVVDRWLPLFSPRSNRSNNNHHHPAATQPPPPPAVEEEGDGIMSSHRPNRRRRTLLGRMIMNFTCLNCLWYIGALAGPLLWNGVPGISKQFTHDDWKERWLDLLDRLGAKAAWPAMWNMALVLLPILRSPILLRYYYFWDDSAEDILLDTRTNLVSLHTRASIAMAFWLAVHALFLTIVYLVRADFSMATFIWQMVPLTRYYTEGIVNFSGWVACVMLLGSWCSSRPSVRNLSYEVLFQFVHILCAIGFVLGSNLHDYNTLMFAWPGFASLLVDRLLRYFSCRHRVAFDRTVMMSREENIQDRRQRNDNNNNNTSPEAITCSILKIHKIGSNLERPIIRFTMQPPKSWWPMRSVQPGKHIYVRDKTISRRQWHPFTISAINQPQQTFTVHIKELGDWTAAFINKWDEQQPQQEHIGRQQQDPDNDLPLEDDNNANYEEKDNILSLEMEGPYGPDLSRLILKSANNGYIFLAGGVGITGVSEAIQVCAEQRGNVPFTVLWLVRSKQEMNALGADLLWNQRFLKSWGSVTEGGTHRASRPLFRVFVTTNDEEGTDNNENGFNSVEPVNYSTLGTKQYNDVPQAHEDDRERQQKTADDGAALIVTTVVIICMAISFLIARQLCCYQSNPSDITCGMACSNSTPPCRKCATMEDIREQFDYELPPCCTITICYLCFRGLPVVLVLFLTPLLAFILLTFLLPTEDAKTPGFIRCFQCSTRLRYQSLNPQEAASAATAQEIRQDIIGTSRKLPQESPISLSDLVSIEFGRPGLQSTLEDVWRDQQYGGNVNDVSSTYQTTTKLLVCGPPRLVESARHATHFYGDKVTLIVV